MLPCDFNFRIVFNVSLIQISDLNRTGGSETTTAVYSTRVENCVQEHKLRCEMGWTCVN
jgi:hypothetical protein